MLVQLAGDVSSNPGPQYHRLVDVARYRGLKIAHLNVRSLRNKLDLISFELVNKKLFDVLTFSETWLDESISDSEVKLDGYNMFRRDGPGNCQGGVLIYLRDNLPGKVREDLNNVENECLWVEVNRRKCKPVLLCCAYKPPDIDTSKLIDRLTGSFSLVNQDKFGMFLLGNLNVDFLEKDSKCKSIRLLKNFATSSGLSQVINAPTRITNISQTMIDLIFVNNEHRIIDSGVIPMSISDHSCVLHVKNWCQKGFS